MIFYNLLRPSATAAFFYTPIMLIAIFIFPVFLTFREKYFWLITGFIITAAISATFSALYLYKATFVFCGVAIFLLLNYIIIKKYFKFRAFIGYMMSAAAISAPISPIGDVVTIKAIVFAIIASMFIMVFGLLIHKNLYVHVWHSALKRYTEVIEVNFKLLLNNQKVIYSKESVRHLTMMFEYKRLIKHNKLLNIMRMSLCCRHINMIVISLQHEKIIHIFWEDFATEFSTFKQKISKKRPYSVPISLVCEQTNAQQKMALAFLEKSAKNWNKVCSSL
ncbi:hypothetical protein OAO18_00765 [Francisellaceae bacterium]|nr:hypothetical protein [Francisellaceae bacterium]